ncbi:MAG: ABC transporter ATP-binding protein [Desulfobacterales bacterium]
MVSELIEIENLSVTFHGVTAVDKISLHINKGEIVALVGESGSGKSVTALSILQLLPYPQAAHPTGSILIDGTEVVGGDEKMLRKIRGAKISMIFQEPMTSLNPLHSIQKQMAEILSVHRGVVGQQARVRTLELLDLVGLQNAEERLKAFPHELSGGQRQRVMIAMALANEPDLLIADEPTTALDVTIQAQILTLMKSLQERLGMAMLLITHDLGMVRYMAERVYVMEMGKIVEFAETRKLFTAPEHPYTIRLLDAEPKGAVSIADDGNRTLVETKHLNVRYPLGGWPKKKYLLAVDDVSLKVREGHSLGVVGESGSGKTTLGMAMVRLIRSEGDILFNGENIQGLSYREIKPLRKEMQIIFQDPYGSLSPRMTIRGIIAEGLTINMPDLSEEACRKQVTDILVEVGLDPNIEERYPHEFSGGQRQRIAIARAMIMNPRFVVLDEPSSALDMTVQAQIIELLKELQQRHNLTYMFISHDLKVVRALCDEIVVMKDGKIIEQGPAEQVYSAPKYDYTKELMKAAFDLDASLQ